ncbi:hypothetical protein BOVA208_4045 [Bacteroides ovatus]|nr:hypothetical protein BOVA208_4045 [Bacteroides ovatus]
MKEFFEAYKKHIVKHPKKSEYKPTNYGKYDTGKLRDVYKKVDTTISCSEEDVVAIKHFVRIFSYIYILYTEFYKLIKNNYLYLNLGGLQSI